MLCNRILTACLVTSALSFGVSTIPAHALDVGVDASVGGLGISAGASTGGTSGGVSANASVGGTGGTGGVNADASVGGLGLGGTSATASVGAGSGVNADVNATIGALSNTNANVGVDVGLPGIPGVSVNLGLNTPGTDPDDTAATDPSTPEQVSVALNDLSPAERAALLTRCQKVLAAPARYDTTSVTVCRLAR